jgi:hypothetical protein
MINIGKKYCAVIILASTMTAQFAKAAVGVYPRYSVLLARQELTSGCSLLASLVFWSNAYDTRPFLESQQSTEMYS